MITSSEEHRTDGNVEFGVLSNDGAISGRATSPQCSKTCIARCMFDSSPSIQTGIGSRFSASPAPQLRTRIMSQSYTTF